MSLVKTWVQELVAMAPVDLRIAHVVPDKPTRVNKNSAIVIEHRMRPRRRIHMLIARLYEHRDLCRSRDERIY
jgi:hypothetical protein